MNDAFCVISQEVPLSMQEELHRQFRDVILLPPDNDLAPPVRCHPDMIFAVLDGRMFLSRRYCEAYPAIVSCIARLGGFSLHPTDDIRTDRYPHDTAFNVIVRDSDKTVICRPASACPALLTLAKERSFRVIPVRQGYAACSCLVTDRTVLTFDRGIVKTLEREQVPCVLLEEGGISLPGYDCGFPGGACGFYADTIYVYGNADTLPCAARLHSTGCRIHSLSGNPVTDYGGIRIFKKV